MCCCFTYIIMYVFVCATLERHIECSTGRLETVPPISTEQVSQILIGRMRGIQGHCNSCYMDAALFRSYYELIPDITYTHFNFKESARYSSQCRTPNGILASCLFLAFSLFSCTSVLDSMLFKSTEPQDAPIQNTLLCDIVNPLRRCVCAHFARHLKIFLVIM